jgi:hypothetical protein
MQQNMHQKYEHSVGGRCRVEGEKTAETDEENFGYIPTPSMCAPQEGHFPLRMRFSSM